MCIVKSESPIGTTWISPVYDNGNNNSRYNYQIVNRDFSYTVRNRTFQNVIKVQVILDVEVAGEWITYMEYYFYFAKGVGLIQQNFGNYGIIDLVDYQIK